ncbi:MAG: NBR1-Ig-like domain-containing protein [Chloroflexota bacterium]
MTYNARFLADVTIPDDTAVSPGKSFVKTWRVLNSGDEPWQDGVHLVFVSGDPMTDMLGHPVPQTSPGQPADLSLLLTAPAAAGTYFSNWRLQNKQGAFFGHLLFVRIVVPEVAPPDEVGLRNGRYLADLTIPDGTRLQPETPFVKTWLVQNNGETTWRDGYSLRFMSGEPMTTALQQPLPLAAPGDQVEVSLSLVTPPGNGRYLSRWRMHDRNGQPFGHILFFDINVIAQPTTTWKFDPPRWRDTIWAITSVFETGTVSGDPAAYQNHDAGIVSYGKHQATLQSGNLGKVLDAYFRRSSSAASRALQQEFAARIAQRDPNLRQDRRLEQLLRDAGREPEMAAAQDELFDQQFYQPTVSQAAAYNITSPLGLACLYDTHIQGGLLILLPQVKDQLHGIIGEMGLDGPLSEEAWLAAFLDRREARLQQLADRAAANGDTLSANALRISTFRVTELRQLLLADNLALEGDLHVRGRIIPGIVF